LSGKQNGGRKKITAQVTFLVKIKIALISVLLPQVLGTKLARDQAGPQQTKANNSKSSSNTKQLDNKKSHLPEITKKYNTTVSYLLSKYNEESTKLLKIRTAEQNKTKLIQKI